MNPYSEIFKEIEDGLWDQDLRVSDGIASPYTYDDLTFRACIKVFMSALLWKLWEAQERLKLDPDKRGKEAEIVGNELRMFVKTWTGIDTVTLYK